jgi:UDP-N-acetylglucosamine 2-epimerase (non-hydrolysing)
MTAISPAAPTVADAATPPPAVMLVGGGPTSFLRVAAVGAALRAAGHRTIVVHSGRPEAGPALDGALAAFGAGPADLCLGLDAPTPAVQTGTVLVEIERLLLDAAPALVVVAGGLDSTLGCALAAAKLGVPVAHLDAGLRSFDWSTTDEINRTLIDRLAQILLTSSTEAGDNLIAEGIAPHAIHHVGSTLADVVRSCEPAARALRTWETAAQVDAQYILVSLHRPEHVGSLTRMAAIAASLAEVAKRHPVLLSLDADARTRLAAHGALAVLDTAGVRTIDRLDYLPFLSLIAGAGAVITDAGAVQDETSALGVACFTLRSATDRPITLGQGTNTLVGDDELPDLSAVAPSTAARCVAPLWDGNAAGRAADVLAAQLASTAGAAHA